MGPPLRESALATHEKGGLQKWKKCEFHVLQNHHCYSIRSGRRGCTNKQICIGGRTPISRMRVECHPARQGGCKREVKSAAGHRYAYVGTPYPEQTRPMLSSNILRVPVPRPVARVVAGAALFRPLIGRGCALSRIRFGSRDVLRDASRAGIYLDPAYGSAPARRGARVASRALQVRVRCVRSSRPARIRWRRWASRPTRARGRRRAPPPAKPSPAPCCSRLTRLVARPVRGAPLWRRASRRWSRSTRPPGGRFAAGVWFTLSPAPIAMRALSKVGQASARAPLDLCRRRSLRGVHRRCSARAVLCDK